MGESRTLEWKQDISNSFLKTVSAFANFGEGSILFGVTDDGSREGLQDPESRCLDIENRINDCISPKPDYSLRIHRKDNVIQLTVQEGPYKPYLYKGKAYRRSDTATVEVDQLELKRLVLEGQNLYFEELPCGEESLQFHYLEAKLEEVLGISQLTEDILRTLGFFNKEKQFNNAAALYADTNHFHGVDIAKFGATISEIQDREVVSGVSILQQYEEAIAVFRRYYQYEKIEGIERTLVERIPEAAFREAVANALIHRSWDMNSHVRISMFPDRIEVASPGGLPKGISREEYLHGSISNLRNPIIGNLFFRLRYIEMFGTGIRRIRDAYRQFSGKPQFQVFDQSIIVTLPIASEEYLISAEEQRVIDLMNSGRVLTGREIAEQLGWNKAKTIRVINALKEAGYIQVIGSGRGTKYQIR